MSEPIPSTDSQSAKPALSLNDLINLHYKQVDLVHKFWNYMWLAGAAVVTVAVSYKPVALMLLLGYVPFALANMWLIFDAQKAASLSAKAILATAKTTEPPLTQEISAALDQMRPWSPWFVVILHALLTSYVIAVLRERVL